MSKPWPEGVPPLPVRQRTWRLHNAPYSDRKIWSWADEVSHELCLPTVTEIGGRVIRVNAAARALGIVPDEEQA